MSDQPNDDGVKCSDIINGTLLTKLDNLTIEQCALACDAIAARAASRNRLYGARDCALAIRKLKKQKDSSGVPT